MYRLLLPLALVACTGEPKEPQTEGPPFGMTLKQDGKLYAGITRLDITPSLDETFQDLNGNGSFDGCTNEPTGAASGRAGCDEPFTDADGDGYFDAIWIAGFGDQRGALGVHDPITLTALVMSLNGEYVAMVGVDAVGILESRIRPGRELLGEAGFDMDRVVVSASHSHQSPDTVGIWGDIDALESGVNEDYAATIPVAIFDAVSTAASEMVEVNPVYGQDNVGRVDPTTSAEVFGGTNPDSWMIGTINDIRDPLVAGDELLAIALNGTDGQRVATLVNFSSHPEVVGDENNELSADYVYYLRDWIERQHGGTTVFISGALGGMQSALSGTLPKMDSEGNRVMEGGEQVWIEGSGWEMAESQGILLGQAVDQITTDSTPWESIRVRSAPVPIPVTNQYYQLAFRLGILDTKAEDLMQDSGCPGYGVDPDVFGCVPAGVWVVQLGPITFGSVPGEVFPELFWGVPDEEAMVDPTKRPTDRRWKRHDPDCDTVDYEDCRDTARLPVDDCDGEGGVCDGVCECLEVHAVPYRVSDDPEILPIRDMLPGTYRAPMGITNGYCGYIVPDPDFNTYASALTEEGDHYEETNSCSREFTTAVQKGFVSLME